MSKDPFDFPLGKLVDINLTEQAFTGQIATYARTMGWRVYRVVSGESRVASGNDDSPLTTRDSLLVCVRRPRVVWIKPKGWRTPLTDAQRAALHELIEEEQEVYALRPRQWKAVESILR